MKNYVLNIFILFTIAGIFLSLASCNKETNTIYSSGWTIDENEIGGSLIPWPLVNEPVYSKVREAQDLDSSSAVLVYKGENDVYVYPIGEIYPVEIVNDVIDGIPLAITYCPLTKSGICWERTLQGEVLNFTPSGYLYQSNLMPYDFETESIWSQMRLEGVLGSLKKVKVSTHQLVETTWYNVEMYFPSARVFNRSKSRSSNGRISMNSSELVFGVIGNRQVDVFSYSSFENQIKLYANFAEKDIIVVGSKNHGFITTFRSKYRMIAIQNEFPVIMRDESGSKWNVFGEALSGPHQGEKLTTPPSYFASRWAFDKIFKDLNIIEN